MTFYPFTALLGAPTGAAGGSLSGTYPNPGIAAGVTITTPTLSGTTTAAAINAAGNVDVTAAGSGLRVAEGANAKQGIATLAAGTVTVANTSVTANSRILVTCQILGTVTVASAFDTPRTAGTSFTIHASQATDTSTVAWEIFEPG